MAANAPPGLGSPLFGTLVKWLSRANVWLYCRTDGRFGATWRVGSAFRKPVPVLLLTTTGRKSGEPRLSPLLYLRDGDRIVVVASQGGRPKHPLWYLNLRADPHVRAQIGREHLDLTARVVEDAEREVLWPRLENSYADFATYQKWTDRTIPVVVLEQ